MIQFGEFLPDQADILNPGVTVATNVMPSAVGYRSMNSFVRTPTRLRGTSFAAFLRRRIVLAITNYLPVTTRSSACTIRPQTILMTSRRRAAMT